MKKKKIGIFVDAFFPVIDGVAVVVDNYAKRLIKDYEVIVFCPSFKDKKIDDSIYPYKIVRSKSISVPTIDYYLPIIDKDFKKELEKSNLDLVHIHSPFTLGKEGTKYAKEHNIPLVGTLHSQFKQDFKRSFKIDKLAKMLSKKITQTYNNCDILFTVNDEIKRIYKEDYGAKKAIKIIENATDMKKIENKKDSVNYINRKHNISEKEKVFLFVGRINKLKNIFFIIDALKIIKEENKIRFKMIYVGDGQDLKDLKEYSRKNNLESDVIFAGKITDREELSKYYLRSDLFLFPSFYDTNSLVQIEAASQKTPTIFVKGSGTSYFVKDNINGFISENNPKDYAKTITKAMIDDKLYNKVSKGAYKEIYKTWDSSVEELKKYYKELISK